MLEKRLRSAHNHNCGMKLIQILQYFGSALITFFRGALKVPFGKLLLVGLQQQ